MLEHARAIRILLVEDNPGDARLAVEALKDGRVVNDLEIVRDGVEAMEFLRHEGDHGDSWTPDLILLDLNLPRKSGREVLAEVKEDKELRRIPVVVFTTSRAEQDILSSYDLQAAAYINKPLEFGQFVDVVRALEGFWLTVVTFPDRGPGVERPAD